MTKQLFCIFMLCFVVFAANAKKKKTYFKLVEAYTQQVIPGIRGPRPKPETHFIIVWENKKCYPEFFLWLKDTGLVYTCNIARAHKVVDKSFRIPQGMDYTTEQITAGSVHKGDTLEVTTISPDKNAFTGDHPLNVNTKNTLVLKSSDNQWWSTFHVDTVMKKRDIVMP